MLVDEFDGLWGWMMHNIEHSAKHIRKINIQDTWAIVLYIVIDNPNL